MSSTFARTSLLSTIARIPAQISRNNSFPTPPPEDSSAAASTSAIEPLRLASIACSLCLFFLAILAPPSLRAVRGIPNIPLQGALLPGDRSRTRWAADRGGAVVGAGAAQLPVLDGAVRAGGIPRRGRGIAVDQLQRALGVRAGSGVCSADRDPVPRWPGGRERDAAARVALAAAQAGGGDADHRTRRRAGRQGDRGVELDGGVPARRAALADRPGADLEHRHEPARAKAHPPLAEPGVGTQRRAGAARGAGLPRRADGRQRTLRVVALRGAGHRSGLPVWARLRVGGLAADALRELTAARARDPLPSEVAVCVGRRLWHLRRHRAGPARQWLHRGVRRGDRARHPPPRPAPALRAARG